MARYMLDTNICIYLMKNQPAAVGRRFAQCYVGDVIISAITLNRLPTAQPLARLVHLRYLLCCLSIFRRFRVDQQLGL